jgi:ketosteroid isomerase-like protein
MKPVFALAVVLVCCLSGPVRAQDKKDEDPAHEELRSVRKALIESFNKRDVDGLLKHVHKDVVVTWQNGEVSRGHAGIRKYFERMLVGDNSVVVEIKADPELPELSSLYGGKTPNTAVAYGTLNDHYQLRDGMDFKMNSLFSATLVKENGQWWIVNFHASTNMFDNEVLHQTVKKTMIYSAGAGLAAGLLLAGIVWFVVGKMRKA